MRIITLILILTSLNISSDEVNDPFEELNRNGTTILLATHNKTLLTDFPKPTLQLLNGSLSLATIKNHQAEPLRT